MKGLGEIEGALRAYRATGARVAVAYFQTLLSQAYQQARAMDAAARQLDEALAFVRQTSERIWESDIHRRKGELLLAVRGDHEARAEECFAESLRIAREQQARSLELRTATSYARLLRSRGEGAAAGELLSPVYEWFDEGLESADLVDAQTQLDELKARSGGA